MALSEDVPGLVKRGNHAAQTGYLKMGTYSDAVASQINEETRHGPTVAAAPGYFVCFVDVDELEPILAWRVGNSLVMPITRGGPYDGECWVVGPDGRVRHHGAPSCAEVPTYESIAEWRAKWKANGSPTTRDHTPWTSRDTPWAASIRTRA